jgi:uncharacterized membrane protein YqjE
MIQTRAEAAGLVVQLQRTAVTQGLLFGAIAAVTGLSFMTAVIVWIAVAAPPSWRGWALGIVSVALLATAIFAAVTAGRKIARDAGLIADYSRGLKLDLAMISLALKDPETEDEDKLAERERAKEKVREAAADKAAAPSTAEGGGAPSPDGPSMQSATAAMRAAAPRPDVSPAGPDAEREAAARPDLLRSAAAASGTATTDSKPAAKSAVSGYAMTGGGKYATTTASASPVAAAATEREMPDEAVRPADLDPTLDERDSAQRQRHGSP